MRFCAIQFWPAVLSTKRRINSSSFISCQVIMLGTNVDRVARWNILIPKIPIFHLLEGIETENFGIFCCHFVYFMFILYILL
jgi:hypothetical protein